MTYYRVTMAFYVEAENDEDARLVAMHYRHLLRPCRRLRLGYTSQAYRMIWGETGTRHGATRLQLASVSWLWSRYDDQGIARRGLQAVLTPSFINLAKSFDVKPVLHPPTNPANRAFCGLLDCVVIDPGTEWCPEQPYFVRDRAIVNAAEVMVACPNKTLDELDWAKARGGTWYTINYTLSKNKPLAIVWPHSGHITYKNWNLVKL